MSKRSKPSILAAILIAAIVTLAVSIVRLVGELQGWAGFPTGPGGEGAIVGIAWLVPLCGIWFGRRVVVASGARPSMGRAFLMPTLAFAGLVGLGAWASEDIPNRAQYIGIVAPSLSLLCLFGWPQVFLVNLLYGLLARIPVVVIQYVAIAREWGTHYEKPHPDLGPMSAAERGFGLMMAQVTFWVPFTVIVAGLFAALGALSVRRPR